jgi:hypothetical protein
VARRLTIWIDVGAGDVGWRPVVTAFHDLLVEVGVPSQLHVMPGDHNSDTYWALHTAEYLRFYADAFAERESATA